MSGWNGVGGGEGSGSKEEAGVTLYTGVPWLRSVDSDNFPHWLLQLPVHIMLVPLIQCWVSVYSSLSILEGSCGHIQVSAKIFTK